MKEAPVKMQQMASLGLLLTIFAGFGQFTTTGGTPVQEQLFRPCTTAAAAVEDSLNSIDVTERVSFIRAVLKEGQDVAWTDAGLVADLGVVLCAFKALQVGAQAFKYDGRCWVRHQGLSPDLLTTDCGTGDAVYVLNMVPCLDGQFQCSDGTCLDGAKRCDDVKDCAFGNDERRCTLDADGCYTDDFRCDGGGCVETERRCDGVYDCADYSDESGCGLGCTPAEFECNDGECVPDTVTCDGTADCAGGEDEPVCEFNMFRGERVKYGEYSGCFYSSPDGMAYGTSGRLVEENLLPEEATCCPYGNDEVCVYPDDIATQDINFCEASARCEALGFSMLSSEMMNPSVYFGVYSLVISGIAPLKFPLNYVRDGQGVWRWMPSGETYQPLNFTKDPTIDQNCSLVDFNFTSQVVGLVAMNCNDVVGYNSLCFQNGTQLPLCNT